MVPLNARQNRVGGSLSSQSLKPVTIKQIVEALLSHPDSPYQIEGHDVTQVQARTSPLLYLPRTA